MSKLSKYEQETIINWNREEDNASIMTFDRVLQNKIEKVCHIEPKIVTVFDNCVCKEYVLSKKLITVSKPYEFHSKPNLVDDFSSTPKEMEVSEND